MTIFERIIPFEERVRWMMLKAAVNYGLSASTIADRLDWPLYRVNRIVMAVSPRVYLRDVAEWFYAIDPEIDIRCEIIR